MDIHGASQPPGFTAINNASLSYCSPSKGLLSAPTTTNSCDKCFHLFPSFPTKHSQTWIPRRSAPLWLQYLSQLLSCPETLSSSPRSSPSSACARLHVHCSSRLADCKKRPSCPWISKPSNQKLSRQASRAFTRAVPPRTCSSIRYTRQPRIHKIMARKVKAPSQAPAAHHMTTRSTASRNSLATETSLSSDSSPLSSVPSSSPSPPSRQTGGQKRTASEVSSDGLEEGVAAKRQCQKPDSELFEEIDEATHLEWKDRNYWPEYDPDNPIYYTSAGIRYRPGATGGTPESRSPSKKSTRGGGRGRGGGHANRGGRAGRGRGKGARGGESPEPPNRRRPLTQDDRVEISMLKARQQELKRFFKVVGAQQIDILDQLAVGDLSRIARKAKTHKGVPEYDMIREALEEQMQEMQATIKARYRVQLEHEEARMRQEREVIENQFKTHVAEARKEHLAGAEGDIILFERAYRADHDDTHTESGSEMDYFPHYHELPEPNRQPRGYVSSKIMDEKPFKQSFTTFDEKARQQVLTEDVIEPLLKEMERRNNDWREEQARKKSQNMEALSAEAEKELANIRGYLIPRPFNMNDANSYALSALADVSEWMAQQYPDKAYIYMPLAPGETFPREALDFSPLPGQLPPLAPAPARRVSTGPAPTQYPYPPVSTLPPPPPPPPTSAVMPPPTLHPAPAALTPTTGPIDRTLPRIMSSGPGQPIAPAPPKHVSTPRPTAGSSNSSFSNIRYNTRSGPPPAPAPVLPAVTTTVSNGPQPQQYIFQPPQQPFQHHPAPGPASTPQYAPSGAGHGVPVGQQSKIPMTFVNQTIASRNAAAATSGSPGHGNGNGNGNGNANGHVKGGQRMLLPKV
ncbi:hypothetical protein HRR83_001037 [Exophiala dermatitidis]|nr:hypothetical protein HRR77_006726 [Exophiala dermatitidis]KAJ4577320.1 hypothetical protein HRR81_003774 [Exophiala dermatitidis]KAJ4605075.1 hypothetical protein HRR83_001037 [Exophiala dermatitidis]KAJ4624024.1 hypothetical protein HRR85_000870 [Exophiala dermatitidis]KAJ4683536.1 hypothetical protein HRR92_002300 [Exophiala dermatitidis]